MAERLDYRDAQTVSELRARVYELERDLGNILARCLRDGGHRQAEVGTRQALIEADLAVATAYARISELEEQLARLAGGENG